MVDGTSLSDSLSVEIRHSTTIKSAQVLLVRWYLLLSLYVDEIFIDAKRNWWEQKNRYYITFYRLSQARETVAWETWVQLCLVVREEGHLANTSQVIGYATCSCSTTTLLPSYHTVRLYYSVAPLYESDK